MNKEHKKIQERYDIALLTTKAFLTGKLEMYKIEFSETANNKYLEVMNNIHSTYKLIINMDYEIKRLSKECRRLQKQLESKK